MGIFSAQMESSIVSTSIVAITNELGGFDKSSWVFTGFMLTYAGTCVIKFLRKVQSYLVL